MQHFHLPCLLLAVLVPSVNADDVRVDDLRASIRKSIPMLENGAAGSSAGNKCFTCHNHALPILTLVEAQNCGFEIDQGNFTDQVHHTLAHLKRGRKRYREGKGLGGQVLTAGYALWALGVSTSGRNETTDVVVDYILQHQKDKGHWLKNGRRPPSDGSVFTANYVALQAITEFASPDQQDVTSSRADAVTTWISNAVPKDTEDAVFRLKLLRLLGHDDEVAAAVDLLVKQHRDDGGWAQKEDMNSDAYATGSVVASLLDEGRLPRDHAVIRAGLRFLLKTQLDDGTWHVVTRADGFQPYYESGFPHEEDQFISIAASCWATMALLRSLPQDVGK